MTESSIPTKKSETKHEQQIVAEERKKETKSEKTKSIRIIHQNDRMLKMLIDDGLLYIREMN